MRALVKHAAAPGALELRDVPVPAIGSQDVLVAVRAAGICGWDIEMWQHSMSRPVTVPVIQGHEFSGTVIHTGSDVQRFQFGDRVVSETAAVICGVCPQCAAGRYNLCPERQGLGCHVDGAFADYIRVPERCLHRLPDNVSFDHGALAEPAAGAYHALVQLSHVCPGEAVLVIGPGPIGLMALQIARLSGAAPIIMVGTARGQARLEAAARLGAAYVIDTGQEDAIKAVEQIAYGRGCSLVVDAAGGSLAFELAMAAAAPGGQITKIGWGPEPIGLSLDPLIAKAVHFQGAFSHTWRAWEAVLQLMEQDQLDLETIISHRIGLEQWADGFALLERSQAIKVIMQWNDEGEA